MLAPTTVVVFIAALGGTGVGMARDRPAGSDSLTCSHLPLTVFAYDRSAPLDLRDSTTKVEDGVQVHTISFESPRGGGATGLMFAPAQLTAGVQVPGIVMQHGMPGRADFVSSVSGNIARHGVIARLDASVTPANAAAYQRAAPEPKRVRWYNLDHSLGWPAILDELDWLHRRLGIAPPGPKTAMWCAVKGRCTSE